MRDGRYETTSGRLQNGYGGNAPWLCRDAQALRHSRNVTIVILARSAETSGNFGCRLSGRAADSACNQKIRIASGRRAVL